MEPDFARTNLCPGGCGKIVRRFESSWDDRKPWWCSECIQAKVIQAREEAEKS